MLLFTNWINWMNKYKLIGYRLWPVNFMLALAESSVLLHICYANNYILYSAKLWQGKTLTNLAKQSSFANILPNLIPDWLYLVTNGSYCKFTNVFLAKTLKRSIRQSFTPPTFCAIRYVGIIDTDLIKIKG